MSLVDMSTGCLPVAARPASLSVTSASSRLQSVLTTALFSFLYHLASYETGGEALVHCGMMESLLAVVSWAGRVPDHVTVSRRRWFLDG